MAAIENVLTVDVEDYFHAEALAKSIPFDSWDSCESRVEGNVDRILALFERHGARGTFFVLGWVARRCPRVVKKILAAGHEIGCHGFAHKRLHSLSPAQFREDLNTAISLITDLTGAPVKCYRAPSFSVVRETMWAFEVMVDLGISIDSSIFPVLHDLYGIPDANRFPHWPISGVEVFEFPPSTLRRFNQNCGVAGGGYLRLAPYRLTQWAIRHINNVERQPVMVYFHPWEIDPQQPRFRSGFRSTFRHYTNLHTMAGKVDRLLTDFSFTNLTAACLQHETYVAATALSKSDVMARGLITAAAKAGGLRR